MKTKNLFCAAVLLAYLFVGCSDGSDDNIGAPVVPEPETPAEPEIFRTAFECKTFAEALDTDFDEFKTAYGKFVLPENRHRTGRRASVAGRIPQNPDRQRAASDNRLGKCRRKSGGHRGRGGGRESRPLAVGILPHRFRNARTGILPRNQIQGQNRRRRVPDHRGDSAIRRGQRHGRPADVHALRRRAGQSLCRADDRPERRQGGADEKLPPDRPFRSAQAGSEGATTILQTAITSSATKYRSGETTTSTSTMHSTKPETSFPQSSIPTRICNRSPTSFSTSPMKSTTRRPN